MSLVGFSLTDRYVCARVGNLRAGGLSPIEGWLGHVEKFVREELVARVVAISTSVFCAADTALHIVLSVYVGVYALLGRVGILEASQNATGAAFLAHIMQASKYALGIIFGTVAGVIYPDALQLWQSPRGPVSNEIVFSDVAMTFIMRRLGQLFVDHYRKDIQPIAKILCPEGGKVDLAQVRKMWKQWKTEGNHVYMDFFVRIFDSAFYPEFKAFRAAMANTVYRQPGARWKNRTVRWLTDDEIRQALEGSKSCWQYVVDLVQRILRIKTVTENIFLQNARLYHETSEENLMSILKSKQIEVRHKKAFKGAWCSIPTHTGLFGRVKLVLKATGAGQSLERSSRLGKGFTVGDQYWAGFSEAVRVDGDTLAGIIVDNPEPGEIERLKEACTEAACREIKVISLKDALPQIAALNSLQLGIPEEWPEEDYGPANAIRKDMRMAMPQPPGPSSAAAVAVRVKYVALLPLRLVVGIISIPGMVIRMFTSRLKAKLRHQERPSGVVA